MRGYLGKDRRINKQSCHIAGCAKWGGDECTDDALTCRMLARMRERYADAAVKSKRRSGR